MNVMVEYRPRRPSTESSQPESRALRLGGEVPARPTAPLHGSLRQSSACTGPAWCRRRGRWTTMVAFVRLCEATPRTMWARGIRSRTPVNRPSRQERPDPPLRNRREEALRHSPPPWWCQVMTAWSARPVTPWNPPDRAALRCRPDAQAPHGSRSACSAAARPERRGDRSTPGATKGTQGQAGDRRREEATGAHRHREPEGHRQ
jgi:hypothetical protein